MRTIEAKSSSRAALQDLGLHGHCCLWLHRAMRAVWSVPEAGTEIYRLRAIWLRSKSKREMKRKRIAF
jgi:hypothetical protein